MTNKTFFYLAISVLLLSFLIVGSYLVEKSTNKHDANPIVSMNNGPDYYYDGPYDAIYSADELHSDYTIKYHPNTMGHTVYVYKMTDDSSGYVFMGEYMFDDLEELLIQDNQ